MQATHNISISLSFSCKLRYHIHCTYLSSYFLGAPPEYVRHGLVLGLDWTFCHFSSKCIFLVCLGPPNILLSVPTIQVSHMHPPLTPGRLNTSTQVNNLAMLHLIYNSHTYVHHIIITIQLFLHTSSIPLSRPDGPDPSCREQVLYVCTVRLLSVGPLNRPIRALNLNWKYGLSRLQIHRDLRDLNSKFRLLRVSITCKVELYVVCLGIWN
jgi:hypothetical protein